MRRDDWAGPQRCPCEQYITNSTGLSLFTRRFQSQGCSDLKTQQAQPPMRLPFLKEAPCSLGPLLSKPWSRIPLKVFELMDELNLYISNVWHAARDPSALLHSTKKSADFWQALVKVFCSNEHPLYCSGCSTYSTDSREHEKVPNPYHR